MVVRKSMETRFFLELFFFFMLVFAFQREILTFTELWNSAIQIFKEIYEIERQAREAEAVGDEELYAELVT